MDNHLKAERNRQYNKAYFSRMTPEERKAFNKAKYLKYKPRHNAQSKQWAKDNPEKTQASVHQSTIQKKYPGTFSKTDIETQALALWLQENNGALCPFCGQEAGHIDHILPLSRGGSHTWRNIRLLCKQCNVGKSNYTDEEFLDWIKKILGSR
jgi:5-methylcytosine-specific restriction endonuclease McrA